MTVKTKTVKGIAWRRPLDETELPILAAIFARSNMGQGVPAKRDVERWKSATDLRTKRPRVPNVEDVVADFCGKFMESDEHQRIFEEEARSWIKSLRRETSESVAQTWPHLAELYWRDPATYVDATGWPNG